MKKIIDKYNFVAVILLMVTIILSSPHMNTFNDIKVNASGVDNITARADYLYNVTWVCQKSFDGFLMNNGTYCSYIKGQTYRIPYGQPVTPLNFITFDVSVDTFLSAASNSSSVLYTKNNGYYHSPYYSLDCSGFVSYCWGIGRADTRSWKNLNVTDLGKCTTSNVSKIQQGDALCLSGSHIVLISRVGNGYEVTEQTTPQMKRSYCSASQLVSNYSNYTIYRYNNRDNVSAPSGGGNTATIVTPAVSFDKSSYTVGETMKISWVASPSGSNLSHYWLQIFNPDGSTALNETMNKNTSYSFKVSQSGTYTVVAWATPQGSKEGEGSLTDTKSITVNPKIWYESLTPADLGNKFDGIILNKNYWKPIRPDDSTNVVLYDEEWRTSEMWRFTRQSDGSYKIENFGNGLCLDAWGMGTANGTNVCTHESNDSMAQRWFIYAVNGGYAFRPAYGELAMDLNGNNNANTTNIHLWEYHGQDAQIFSIYNNNVSEYAKPAPNTPRVSATGETSVSISWDAVAYVEKYVVYRSTNNSNWSKIGETTATSYTDNGLSASTKYYYKYECVNRFYTVSSSSVSATTNAIPEYTITFDANGGNCSPTSKVVRLGNVYGDLPDATKTGYTFNGWYTEKNGGSQVTKDTKMNTANNHTLYAHWTANQYIVIYDANTGTGTMDNSTITYDMESSLRKNTFTKAGYSFECWSDGNGHYYSDEANVKNLVTSGSTTLWVKWKPNQYTVKLDANGGTVSPESITVTYDGTYSNLPDPTRTGYFFNGWFPENGAQISNPDVVKITSDLTLYAHWSQERMMISFNANGGTSETANKLVTFDNKYGVLPNATKTGYTFEGWYLDENFTTPITESSIVKITANQSVYAKWNLEVYTIKFDGNGGSAETSSKKVVYGRTYGVLPIAGKKNDVFIGWFTEDGTEITSGTVVTISGDTVLYAKWQSEIKVDGDVNSDGVLDVADVKFLQNYLHHKDTFTKETFESADLNNDGKVNVIDLALLKRLIFGKDGGA